MNINHEDRFSIKNPQLENKKFKKFLRSFYQSTIECHNKQIN